MVGRSRREGGDNKLKACEDKMYAVYIYIYQNKIVYAGCETELVCREFTEERVVVDGNIITSRGPGTAEEFALKCIAAMGSAELSEQIQIYSQEYGHIKELELLINIQVV